MGNIKMEAEHPIVGKMFVPARSSAAHNTYLIFSLYLSSEQIKKIGVNNIPNDNEYLFLRYAVDGVYDEELERWNDPSDLYYAYVVSNDTAMPGVVQDTNIVVLSKSYIGRFLRPIAEQESA
jgi:hypothetical protein